MIKLPEHPKALVQSLLELFCVRVEFDLDVDIRFGRIVNQGIELCADRFLQEQQLKNGGQF
jgi:hypothetical protein